MGEKRLRETHQYSNQLESQKPALPFPQSIKFMDPWFAGSFILVGSLLGYLLSYRIYGQIDSRQSSDLLIHGLISVFGGIFVYSLVVALAKSHHKQNELILAHEKMKQMAELALEGHRQQLHMVIASLDDLVLEVDDGGIILQSYCGKTDVYERLQLNREARFVWDLFSLKMGTELRSLFNDAALRNEPQTLDLRLETVNRWARIRVSCLSPLTEIRQIGFSIVLSDISKMKLSEQKMFFSSRMSSLSEMANGMAHEINNPLTIISSTSSLLINEVSKEISNKEKLEKYAQRVITNSDRIVRIINSVRAFARSDEDLPYEKVEVQDLIQGTLDLCRENLKTQGIEVRFAFSLPEKQTLDCRIAQIEQVIFGLILNSIDALKSLEEKWIEISAHEISPGRLQIRITDSGKGIPEPMHERIFQPFFTTKPPGLGTGLGLSVAHNLIRQHQGVIFLDDRHPQTSFFIELPLRRERKNLSVA